MSSTIQYCSDLHLEFPENKAWMAQHPIQVKAPFLVLAGDILPLRLIDQYSDFFDLLSDQFEKVIWIPGNHEYYHDDLSHYPSQMEEQIRENILLVNNCAIQLGNIKLICSTLWTHISDTNRWAVQQGMNDFRLIKYEGKPMNVDHYNQLHKTSLDFISNELIQPSNSTIVMSHHVPTFMHYPERYRGDALNEAFAVELHDLIHDQPILAWIYGHHHQAVPEFEIGGTKMLTNQLGYVRYREHLSFDCQAIVSW